MYYDLDNKGWILVDSRGNLVISDLKGPIDMYMLKHMFKNWKKVPLDDKQVIQNIIHERYTMCTRVFIFYLSILHIFFA